MDLSKWWWVTDDGRKLWKYLNSLTIAERNHPDNKSTCDLMLERYGGIYFFKPFPAQLPILQDETQSIFVHGNNSSGKSYAVAACTSYYVVGHSPYYNIPKPKYGDRIIWAFSPVFDIQRSSSQVHLFATDSPGSIGLLPSFKTIEQYGGKVVWAKRAGCLDYVEFPASWGTYRTKLEFKSGEMQEKNLQASGIDFAWFDEYVKQGHHDEIIARLMRKNGRMVMSFILRPDELATSYVTQDLYTRYLAGDNEHLNFHFLAVEDNKSISESERDLHLSRYGSSSKVWRFSSGGFFNLVPYGDKVFPDYVDEIHVKPEVYKLFDPHRRLFISWDMGYKVPCAIGAQLTRDGRLNILFCKIGKNSQILDFIDDVNGVVKELLPNVLVQHDLIPHDSKRHNPNTPYTTEDLFNEVRNNEVTVLYTFRESGFDLCNKRLREIKGGIPIILIDEEHASALKDCLKYYVRSEEDGKPKEDNWYEHPADAFKQLISYTLATSDISGIDHHVPGYAAEKQSTSKIQFKLGGTSWQ